MCNACACQRDTRDLAGRHGRAGWGHHGGMTDERDTEQDVAGDPAQALSRSEGGADEPAATDRHSTTGTTPNEDHVGRVAGDDGGGYEGLTGAEARARDASG
jgi:hypothetical protein